MTEMNEQREQSNACIDSAEKRLNCAKSEIDDKLNEKFRQQMDGILDEDEELKLRLIAKSYAMCENSIAVLSNHRTGKSYIYESTPKTPPLKFCFLFV